MEFPLTSREQEQATTATANSNEQQDVIAISEQIFLKVIGPFLNQLFYYYYSLILILVLQVNDILVKVNEDLLNNLKDRAKFMTEFEIDPNSSSNSEKLIDLSRIILTQLD